MRYHKGFIAPLLLALIAFLIAGAGAYVYQQTVPANNPVTASTVQTGDLELYKNEQYGIEFYYPKAETVVLLDESAVPGNNVGQKVVSVLIRNSNRVPNVQCVEGVDTRCSTVATADGRTAVLQFSLSGNVIAWIPLPERKTALFSLSCDSLETRLSTEGDYCQISDKRINAFKNSLETFKSVSLTGSTTNETASWKIYENSRFGYSIRYPDSWVAEPEERIMDQTNKIESIIKLHDQENAHTVQITVNQKEAQLKYSAPQRYPITVLGSTQAAYAFPEGYECLMADPERRDCSFFIVPLYHSGLWYELLAKGDARTITTLYEDILSTFAFLNSSAGANL